MNNKRLSILSIHVAPTYLGVKFDRMLSFKQHLKAVKSKVTTRVALIRCLAGTTWGASAKMLRISIQVLVFSTVEYCTPVWCRSPHAKKVHMVINSALRIISGCLKMTLVFLLPVLAGITPPKLRRQAATLALARKAVSDKQHILHNATTAEVP